LNCRYLTDWTVTPPSSLTEYETLPICISFYRTTLCVTLVDCIQTAEDIVKLLSRPDSPITLVFF